MSAEKGETEEGTYKPAFGEGALEDRCKKGVFSVVSDAKTEIEKNGPVRNTDESQKGRSANEKSETTRVEMISRHVRDREPVEDVATVVPDVVHSETFSIVKSDPHLPLLPRDLSSLDLEPGSLSLDNLERLQRVALDEAAPGRLEIVLPVLKLIPRELLPSRLQVEDRLGARSGEDGRVLERVERKVVGAEDGDERDRACVVVLVRVVRRSVVEHEWDEAPHLVGSVASICRRARRKGGRSESCTDK